MYLPRRWFWPMVLIWPSLTATAGAPCLGVDLDLAAVVLGVDEVGGVLACFDAFGGFGFLEVVGVAGPCGDREPALGQPGQRPDQIGGDPGDQPGAQQDGVDVPVGVVIGKDRAADVLVIAGGLQIAAGGEDRVDGVIGVLSAVLVRIDPIRPPRRRDELHPPQRTSRRDIQVAPIVGLDLVDRGQHLPPHPILNPSRLIDRQQENRHPELPDHEIRDPRPKRRPRQRIHKPRIRPRRRTITITQTGAVGGAALLARRLGAAGGLGALGLAGASLVAAALLLRLPLELWRRLVGPGRRRGRGCRRGRGGLRGGSRCRSGCGRAGGCAAGAGGAAGAVAGGWRPAGGGSVGSPCAQAGARRGPCRPRRPAARRAQRPPSRSSGCRRPAERSRLAGLRRRTRTRSTRP